MKRRLFVCLALLVSTTAVAQEPDLFSEPEEQPRQAELFTPRVAPKAAEDQVPEITPAEMTPELYLYLQQQRRHDDPAQAVRRKAEIKAQQRMGRLAAMKWFGMSNARPQANPVPFMGVYSPSWVGNGYDRYDWAGIGWPAASISIEANTISR